jgi:hypothetical protein
VVITTSNSLPVGSYYSPLHLCRTLSRGSAFRNRSFSRSPTCYASWTRVHPINHYDTFSADSIVRKIFISSITQVTPSTIKRSLQCSVSNITPSFASMILKNIVRTHLAYCSMRDALSSTFSLYLREILSPRRTNTTSWETRLIDSTSKVQYIEANDCLGAMVESSSITVSSNLQ